MEDKLILGAMKHFMRVGVKESIQQNTKHLKKDTKLDDTQVKGDESICSIEERKTKPKQHFSPTPEYGKYAKKRSTSHDDSYNSKLD